MTILSGDRKWRSTGWFNVIAAKKAFLHARTVSGDATDCVLTVYKSANGDDSDNGVAMSATLGSITAAGVASSSAIDVDGVAFIRAVITTPSTNDSMIEVDFSVQQEV